MKPSRSKKSRKTLRARSRQKMTVLIVAAAAAFLTAAYFIWEAGRPSSPAPVAAGAPAKVDLQRLLGDWVRPDGGYVISVRRIEPGGRVEAAYLNPRPIPVSRAEASAAGDKARLFIELRGAGYPGSTYELLHDPAGDFLSGVYFQAALGQRFDVVFVRKK